MKATIEFDDDLYRQLKSTAALRGKKVRELVAEGVLMALSKPEGLSPHRRMKFPLIHSKRKTPLDIPDDIVYRMDMMEDLERHAASLR